MARSVAEVEFHNPGWRPELQAEMANCVRGVTEVSLLAFPEDCPTYDQADAWVRARLPEQDLPLRVVTTLRGTSSTTTVPSTRLGCCRRGRSSARRRVGGVLPGLRLLGPVGRDG
jgi:hypothetical protein